MSDESFWSDFCFLKQKLRIWISATPVSEMWGFINWIKKKEEAENKLNKQITNDFSLTVKTGW